MNIKTFRPAYFVRRVMQWQHERTHDSVPWLTENAIYLLDNWIRSTDLGFEWGSGRSTIWLARRARRLISVEHDETWYARVRQLIEADHLEEVVDYRFVPCHLSGADEPDSHPYADVIDQLEDESLDWVLVDGRIRLTCMRTAMAKLRVGGLLILDNANRYFPNAFDGAHTTVSEPCDAPKSEGWSKLVDDLASWRWINTSNGIWDTRCWVKMLEKRAE